MIYIVRHGETQWNAEGRIQGRQDIELNEKGRQQMERAARELAGRRFQVMITSPLARAKESGAILAQSVEIGEVLEDERLIEREFGELDGARFSEDVRHRLYQEKVQGAESLEAVGERMFAAITAYVEAYEGDLLIVSHGSAITQLLKRIDPSLQPVHIHLNNASISLVERCDGALRVVDYNMDAAYLNGADGEDE